MHEVLKDEDKEFDGSVAWAAVYDPPQAREPFHLSPLVSFPSLPSLSLPILPSSGRRGCLQGGLRASS